MLRQPRSLHPYETASTPPAPPPVRTVDTLDAFDAIFSAAVDGVIWRRELPSFLPPALDPITSEMTEERRVRLTVAAPEAGVCDLLDEFGFKDGPAARWLADDLKALIARYGALLSVTHVILRFEIVRDDACRKFHRDVVRARLICTYSGPGTEYGVAAPNHTPETVSRVPTGCPVLLKGKQWPRSAPQTVLHRSPPVEEIGAARLVVVIDED